MPSVLGWPKCAASATAPVGVHYPLPSNVNQVDSSRACRRTECLKFQNGLPHAKPEGCRPHFSLDSLVATRDLLAMFWNAGWANHYPVAYLPTTVCKFFRSFQFMFITGTFLGRCRDNARIVTEAAVNLERVPQSRAARRYVCIYLFGCWFSQFSLSRITCFSPVTNVITGCLTYSHGFAG